MLQAEGYLTHMIPIGIMCVMVTIDSATQLPDTRHTRRAGILVAARAVFFECGFGGASMNVIAARIGGSKTTLWSYFPSKELLFEAVVDDLVERYGSWIEDVVLDSSYSRKALLRFALAVLQVHASDDVMALHRLVVSEAARVPELGRSYFYKGIGRAEMRLAAFLEETAERGIFRIDDPQRAARVFLALCEAGLVRDRLLGLTTIATQGQLEDEAGSIVGEFWRAFSP